MTKDFSKLYLYNINANAQFDVYHTIKQQKHIPTPTYSLLPHSLKGISSLYWETKTSDTMFFNKKQQHKNIKINCVLLQWNKKNCLHCSVVYLTQLQQPRGSMYFIRQREKEKKSFFDVSHVRFQLSRPRWRRWAGWGAGITSNLTAKAESLTKVNRCWYCQIMLQQWAS